MLKIILSFLFLSLTHSISNAENLKLPQFKASTGNLFELKFGSIESNVILAVVSSSSDKLVIEIHSNVSSSMIPIEMTQQFHLKIKDNKVYISEGYINVPVLGKATYRLDSEYLQGYDGVQMASFLDFKPNSKFKKIADSKVKTDSGEFEATQYRFKENSQSIDFWIAEKIKPFSIAAIRSSGSKKDQNYMLSYKDNLNSYRSKIDISKAQAMDKKLKAMLPTPSKSKQFLLP